MKYLISLLQIKSRRTDDQFKVHAHRSRLGIRRDRALKSAETVPRFILVGGCDEVTGRKKSDEYSSGGKRNVNVNNNTLAVFQPADIYIGTHAARAIRQ